MAHIESYSDIAELIERLLRYQLKDRWEIDDFESIPFARREKDPNWHLELWRRCVLDVASVKLPPEGSYFHPDARPQLIKIMEVLLYLEENA